MGKKIKKENGKSKTEIIWINLCNYE